jgi:hypothetical protein
MASQKAISGNSQPKTGTTILGGNASSTGSVAVNDLSIRESAVRSRNTDPVVSAYQGNTKAYSSGSFCSIEQSNFVIMGTPFNVAGVSSTVLRSPSNVAGRATHKVTSSKQVTLTGLQWASTAGLPTYTLTKSASTITYATDNGNNPRVTFLYGASNPTSSTI